MTSQEILTEYIEFYKARGHAEIPSVSLVPEGDSTLLFVNSGMFPLVPYLSGEPHPSGKRLVNVQRSLRFEDIEEVGLSNRHTTCFHMLGNWGLADYFKQEQLNWVYELYIDVLGLEPNKLYASVFEGDEDAPKDIESIEIIKAIFNKYGIEAKEGERIFAYDKVENWWQRGDAVGELGGPDSEVFYYIGSEGDGLGKDPAEFQDDFIEIGNSVFMQYVRTEEGWQELPQRNVDYGGGFERIAMVVQKKADIYQTDNFWPLIEKIEMLADRKYQQDEETTRAMRILADHIRAATFLAMDGVLPSNKDQGYALRRFLRRIVRYGRQLGIKTSCATHLIDEVAQMFAWLYPQLSAQSESMKDVFTEEEKRFVKVLEKATRKVQRRLDHYQGGLPELAEIGFDLYQSLGYPPEMLLDDVRDRGIVVDEIEFREAYAEKYQQHQAESRRGSEQKFKGGLADHSEQVLKYHTTTHLVHWALRQVLGDEVVQHGSNITNERLRFDFNHDQKLTEAQVVAVERLVNDKIVEALPVQFEMMEKAAALKVGAIHAFGDQYPDQVKVYYIGDDLVRALSKEFCGGPHVESTGDLAPIEIYKQESVGKGVRRIYVRAQTRSDDS